MSTKSSKTVYVTKDKITTVTTKVTRNKNTKKNPTPSKTTVIYITPKSRTIVTTTVSSKKK